jgi:hypothetical protein
MSDWMVCLMCDVSYNLMSGGGKWLEVDVRPHCPCIFVTSACSIIKSHEKRLYYNVYTAITVIWYKITSIEQGSSIIKELLLKGTNAQHPPAAITSSFPHHPKYLWYLAGILHKSQSSEFSLRHCPSRLIRCLRFSHGPVLEQAKLDAKGHQRLRFLSATDVDHQTDHRERNLSIQVICLMPNQHIDKERQCWMWPRGLGRNLDRPWSDGAFHTDSNSPVPPANRAGAVWSPQGRQC